MSIPLNVPKWERLPLEGLERLVDGPRLLTSWWSFWQSMQRV
jgi:hypothetical protein